MKWADVEYFKLYKLQFVAGGPYAKGDTVTGWVINQTLAAKLGIRNPKDAIGKYIKLWDDKNKNKQITGVVKDFNVNSLKNAIEPVLMAPWKELYQKLNIKIAPQNINQTMAGIEKTWNSTFPDGLYEYQFLDDKIAGFYKSEDQLAQLYKIFAGIAIFISCLGLYGLISFMTVQRVKEVGIRKTLGASVGHIVYLFSKEFTLLILVAFAISAPVGWTVMNKYFLQGYTYKISFGPGIFLLAIIASLAIAWLTVGYKALRAAMANPVTSLKTE
jgi:putative ABC transport system permease protein